MNMNEFVERIRNAKHVVVHGGVCHADDVFFVATAKMINPDLETIRVNDPKVAKEYDSDPSYIVGDIGGGRWDHHDLTPKVREDGTPYAAFGLLWADVGEHICKSPEIANKIEDWFIKSLDKSDNGDFSSPNYISTLAKQFHPARGETFTMDEGFQMAVEFATQILMRSIRSATDVVEAYKLVSDYAEDSPAPYLVLGEFHPYSEWEQDHFEYRWCIYPTPRGWILRPMLDHFWDHPIPKEWWGAPEDKLPEGMHFCHKTGFLCSCASKEDALRIAREIEDGLVMNGAEFDPEKIKQRKLMDSFVDDVNRLMDEYTKKGLPYSLQLKLI